MPDDTLIQGLQPGLDPDALGPVPASGFGALTRLQKAGAILNAIGRGSAGVAAGAFHDPGAAQLIAQQDAMDLRRHLANQEMAQRQAQMGLEQQRFNAENEFRNQQLDLEKQRQAYLEKMPQSMGQGLTPGGNIAQILRSPTGEISAQVPQVHETAPPITTPPSFA